MLFVDTSTALEWIYFPLNMFSSNRLLGFVTSWETTHQVAVLWFLRLPRLWVLKAKSARGQVCGHDFSWTFKTFLFFILFVAPRLPCPKSPGIWKDRTRSDDPYPWGLKTLGPQLNAVRTSYMTSQVSLGLKLDFHISCTQGPLEQNMK